MARGQGQCEGSHTLPPASPQGHSPMAWVTGDGTGLGACFPQGGGRRSVRGGLSSRAGVRRGREGFRPGLSARKPSEPSWLQARTARGTQRPSTWPPCHEDAGGALSSERDSPGDGWGRSGQPRRAPRRDPASAQRQGGRGYSPALHPGLLPQGRLWDQACPKRHTIGNILGGA